MNDFRDLRTEFGCGYRLKMREDAGVHVCLRIRNASPTLEFIASVTGALPYAFMELWVRLCFIKFTKALFAPAQHNRLRLCTETDSVIFVVA